MKPLRMFYGHNVVRVLRGYVFVQEGLEGFGEWEGTELCNELGDRIGEPLSAKDLGAKVRDSLMDHSSTNIPEVKLLINKTKTEIIQIFHDIRELGNKIKREQGTSLGVFVVNISFMYDEDYSVT